MNETWNVSEIFYSLAGEGSLVGLPMIFIRLSGCNIHCQFCDQKKSWEDGKQMTWQEIYDEIVDFPCHNVCITGGEPFLQNLIKLTQELHDKDYFISIETNGAIYQSIQVDLVIISPKKEIDKNLTLWNDIEWKFVIENEASFEKIYNCEIGYEEVYLQPVNNNPEVIKLCVNKILDEGHRNWRLSLQTHKILEIK